ncbi:MAG: hypothetical protein HND27_10610 [Bacteroidetes bacterium]|jgi:hypothetical protein|nr:hypothetical protein [Bacteroidota bacterium]NOG96212.1 hypothetical protein [Bacteroidota bacterium]
MRKRVLLLAVSCKTGGLCPGGLDLDDPTKWIRIVRDDGQAGAVQGREIDFAKPLDIIEFDGRHMPQGKQQENWVIDNNSCRKVGSRTEDALQWAFQQYSYKGFWGNYRTFLNEQEFNSVNVPTESFMRVTNVRIYKNEWDKAKIDFNWDGARYRITGVSMTDQDFYDRIRNGDVTFENAYILTSIPKVIDDWVHPETGEKRAYKFVSKIYGI